MSCKKPSRTFPEIQTQEISDGISIGGDYVAINSRFEERMKKIHVHFGSNFQNFGNFGRLRSQACFFTM